MITSRASGLFTGCLSFSLPYLDADGVLGRVPQSVLDEEEAHLLTAHENSNELQNLKQVSENAYKQYLKSRPNPSSESIKRVKTSDLSSIAVHPLIGLYDFLSQLYLCMNVFIDLTLYRAAFSGVFQGQGLRRWNWIDYRWLTPSRFTSQNQ